MLPSKYTRCDYSLSLIELMKEKNRKLKAMTTHELPEKMATPIIPVTPALNACSLSVSECETMSADTIPNSVLVNTFVIRKKQYRVTFSAGKLVWERVKSKDNRVTISIENILAIEYQVTNSPVPSKNEQKQSDETIDIEKPPNIKQFTIVYAKRMENSSNPNKWRHFSQTLQNDDSHVCQSWIETLQQQLDGENIFQHFKACGLFSTVFLDWHFIKLVLVLVWFSSKMSRNKAILSECSCNLSN